MATKGSRSSGTKHYHQQKSKKGITAKQDDKTAKLV